MGNVREVSISGASEFETVSLGGSDHVFVNDIRGVLLTTAGAVNVETKKGETHVLNLAAGVIHPINGLAKILDSGTTATDIKGAY